MRVKQKGFTLVELIVVMAVFMVVLMITSSSFKTALDQSIKLFRSEESNIEGVIGLEMLRHDLQQAGFGLFSETSPVNYPGEASGALASLYNDFNTGNEPPRPIVSGNNLGSGLSDVVSSKRYNVITGTDYLAIKATTVSTSKPAQKWTYLEFSPPNVTPHTWVSGSENSENNDSVVLLKRQVNAATQRTTLVTDPSGSFYYSFSNSAFSSFSSASNATFTVYGIDSRSDHTIRMPFNRTDYFVALPATSSGTPDTTRIPSFCAKDSSGNPNPVIGILYKTTVDQDPDSAGGKLTYMPILDCVADMQVVLGWDMDGDGSIDMYSNADGTVCSGGVACAASVSAALSAANNNSAATLPNIRNNLKMVKVYVLAQDGRRDPGYTSPSPIVVGDAAEMALTRSYDLAANNLLNYRWKLYRIVVRPKNLPANQ